MCVGGGGGEGVCLGRGVVCVCQRGWGCSVCLGGGGVMCVCLCV